MSDSQIIQTLQDWADELTKSNFLLDFLRDLGWKLICGLETCIELLYSSLNEVYKFMSFGTSAGMLNFTASFTPLLRILLTIAIMLLGYKLIIQKDKGQGNILQNIILMILVVTSMPLITNQLADLTMAGRNYIADQYVEEVDESRTEGGVVNASPAMTIIKANVIDFAYLDSLPVFPTSSEVKSATYTKNTLTNDSISYVDASEAMDDDMDLNNKFWKYKIKVGSDGTNEKAKINSTFSPFKSWYYRYSVNWFTLIVELLAITIALFFMILRTARITWEIAVNQIIAPFIAVTDLSTGQRLKEVLRHFIGLFAVLFFICCQFGMYFIGLVWLNSIDVNTVVYFAGFIALTWLVIDGAVIIERVLGIDAGIKSGYQMFAGMYAATRTAGAVGRSVRNAAVGDPRTHTKTEYNKDGTTKTKRSLGGLAGMAKSVGTAGVSVVGGAKAVDAIGKKFEESKQKKKDDVAGFTQGEGLYGAVRNVADKSDAKKMGENNRGGQSFYDNQKKTAGVYGSEQGNEKNGGAKGAETAGTAAAAAAAGAAAKNGASKNDSSNASTQRPEYTAKRRKISSGINAGGVRFDNQGKIVNPKNTPQNGPTAAEKTKEGSTLHKKANPPSEPISSPISGASKREDKEPPIKESSKRTDSSLNTANTSNSAPARTENISNKAGGVAGSGAGTGKERGGSRFDGSTSPMEKQTKREEKADKKPTGFTGKNPKGPKGKE